MKMNFVSDLAGRQTLHDGSGTRRVKVRRDPAATLHEFSRLIGVSPTSVRRIFFGDLERPKEAFQAGRKYTTVCLSSTCGSAPMRSGCL